MSKDLIKLKEEISSIVRELTQYSQKIEAAKVLSLLSIAESLEKYTTPIYRIEEKPELKTEDEIIISKLEELKKIFKENRIESKMKEEKPTKICKTNMRGIPTFKITDSAGNKIQPKHENEMFAITEDGRLITIVKTAQIAKDQFKEYSSVEEHLRYIPRILYTVIFEK